MVDRHSAVLKTRLPNENERSLWSCSTSASHALLILTPTTLRLVRCAPATAAAIREAFAADESLDSLLQGVEQTRIELIGLLRVEWQLKSNRLLLDEVGAISTTTHEVRFDDGTIGDAFVRRLQRYLGTGFTVSLGRLKPAEAIGLPMQLMFFTLVLTTFCSWAVMFLEEATVSVRRVLAGQEHWHWPLLLGLVVEIALAVWLVRRLTAPGDRLILARTGARVR